MTAADTTPATMSGEAFSCYVSPDGKVSIIEYYCHERGQSSWCAVPPRGNADAGDRHLPLHSRPVVRVIADDPADHKPACAEVRPADTCHFAMGKEEAAMLLNESPVLSPAPRSVAGVTQAVRRSASPATAGGQPTNPVLADLRRAFLRQSAQIKVYREKRDEELAEAGD